MSLEVTVGDDGMICIRETEEPEVVAVTTRAKWDAFVMGVKAGEFDHFVEGADPEEPAAPVAGGTEPHTPVAR